MTTLERLGNNPDPSDAEIKGRSRRQSVLSLTGYENILKSVRLAAQRLRSTSAA